MTEIIDILKKYTNGKQNIEKVEISVFQLNRIIKALEQESCEDCISRDKTIVQLSRFLSDSDDDLNAVIHKCIKTLKIMPSVTPQQKMGIWMLDKVLHNHYYCSECKAKGVDYWDYCPNCGTKMEVVQNDTN